MFGALRRCPASLSKSLSSAALCTRSIRTSLPQSSLAVRSSALRLNNGAIAAFHQSAKWRQVAATAEASQPTLADEPVTTFQGLQDRGLVHPNLIRTITRNMRLENMTEVQTRTINEALTGQDVIAQAKTGTGKTLGFLIPIIQRMLEHDPNLAQPRRGYRGARADDIRAIVVSPTRELAEQIAVEARKVTQGTGIIVQTAVGGTQKSMMLRKTQREGCHLLIGTPGRLCDVLSDDYSGIKAPGLNAFVMDEADRLLDDGFSKEIEEMKKFLPDPAEVDRQTLMFSATVPRNVIDLVRRTLKPGFHFANCVNEDEEPTHQRVPQKVVHLTGFENIMPTLYELICREYQQGQSGEKRPFKAIVYFNSTAEVTLASSIFYKLNGGFRSKGPLTGMRTFEIHSKLSQAQRTKASDNFRHSNSAVLFSSDVTARGMDFPNVTHVIQIGLPRDGESYVHRLGRTGRAGKEGEGWLFVTPIDEHEMRKRLPRNLPLQVDNTLEIPQVDMSAASEVPENVSQILEQVVEAHKKVYPDELENAFRGLFGAFQSYGDRRGLLEAANRLAEFGWGMPTPPSPPSSFMSLLNSRGGRGGRGGGGGRGGDRYGGDRFGGDRFGGRSGDRRSGGFGGGQRSSGPRDQRSGGFGQRSSDRGGDRGFNQRGAGQGGWGRGDARESRNPTFDF